MDICNTCLSADRNLSPLGDCACVFGKLFGDSLISHRQKLLQICWECRATLKKIVKFQEKVSKASVLLEQSYTEKRIYSSLSSLKNTKITDIILIEDIDNTADVIKPETIEKKYTEIYDDKYDDRFDNIGTNESSEHNAKEGLSLDSREKERNKKWIKTKVKLNKKPKFRILKSIDTIVKEFTRKHLNIRPEELNDIKTYESDGEYFRSKYYKCNECVIGFDNEILLLNHSTKRHAKGLGKYECDICKIIFKDKSILSKHCKSHYCIYKCNICQFKCWKRSSLMWHMRKSHRKIYQCVKCNLGFNRKEFFLHYKKWHENFICDQCGVAFKMRYCIEEHIRKQHALFKCFPCNKSYRRPNALWLHNKLKHAPLGGAYCVECDKHFTCSYAYSWHLNSSVRHSAPKVVRVPCTKCDKTFTKKAYMKDHYDLVHLKLYKNQCKLCDKNFLRNADLMKHKRRVHEGLRPPRDKVCYICGRGFTLNKILDNHIRTHTGERPFACESCPKKFAQNSALLSHRRTVHKNK